jgi:hypothetical protein
LAHEGGKVVSPAHRPPLPPRKYSWYSFLVVSGSITDGVIGIFYWHHTCGRTMALESTQPLT